MIVRDLVASAQMMEAETKEGIFVVYERYENNECEGYGRTFTQKECEPEERVEVLEEKHGGSLKQLFTYSVKGDVAPVLDKIRTEHPELFIKKEALVG
ncbi:hypothetical protein [Alteribacter aurantiacus]|uniref:hypothetical protein n=1 Tax=Alteribacter aurantiacus TaxID=254410 RepID=UPI0004229BF9|nr:hypothetical protein [Alteribacter aurantiacus]